MSERYFKAEFIVDNSNVKIDPNEEPIALTIAKIIVFIFLYLLCLEFSHYSIHV